VANNTISFGKTNKRYPSLIVDTIRELRAVQGENKVDKEVITQIDYYNDHLNLSQTGVFQHLGYIKTLYCPTKARVTQG
jgi:hypothetical protein